MHIPQYPEPNPVNVDEGRLKWAQEMHLTNIRVSAEQLGILEPKPKPKRRWWHRNKADPETTQQQPIY